MLPVRACALAVVAAAGLAGMSVVACAPRAGGVKSVRAAHGVSFNQVRAILRDSCEHCHNEETAEGSLVLKSYDTLIEGGESGSPIVPGKSASSLLVQAIEGRVKPRMPYKEDPLSVVEIDTIRRWIDAGAPAPSAAEAASDDEVKVDIPDVRPTVAVSGPVSAVAFDVTGRRIAVGSYKSVHLLSFDERKWIRSLDGHADLVRALAFSADGTRLAAAGGASGGVGEVRIWDVQQTPARAIATIQGHKDAILSVAFSPDGSTIATGSYDKLVKLWDAATGKELRTLKEHSDAVYSVAFLPGGTQLVSGAGDRTLKIWDVQRGTRLFTISDALDAIYAVAVHPSGSRLAAAGADRMIRTWTWNGDVGSAAGPGATLLNSAFAHGDAVLGLAYSADGDALVSAGADRTIKIWDAATLGEKRLLEPQPDWVLGLALSGDGHWLAAGRYDGTLGLYSLANGGAGELFNLPAPGKK
jgi:WD40 repeat protein